MFKHKELVHLMKIEALQRKLADGDQQALNNDFADTSILDVIQETKSKINA